MRTAAATLVLATTGLIGHACGASVLSGLNRWGGTAVPTAVALTSLAFGVIYADPSRGVAAVSVSDSAGGHLIRRLTPVALLAPLLIGWLSLEAQERGIVDAEFGTALLVVSLIVLLVGLIIQQATVLHAADAERERLLAREREAHEQVTAILESITDAFFAVDRQWRFMYVNREADLRTNGSGPQGGDWIAIRVADTGPGIPVEKQELIFQEFTRLDPQAQYGAGVGLAISHRIVRLLGGDITVESEVGHGSAFTLWLPC